MTDRMVTVNEADLLFALDYAPRGRGFHAIARLRAALDALSPEPCGQWVRVPGHHDEPTDWGCTAHSEGQNCCADRDDVWMKVDDDD